MREEPKFETVSDGNEIIWTLTIPQGMKWSIIDSTPRNKSTKIIIIDKIIKVGEEVVRQTEGKC